jgi:outer membrane protein
MRIVTLIALCAVAFGATALNAQMKIGHLSSEAIMQQLPDAQDAQRQLDVLVAEWQGTLTKMQGEWKQKFDDYDKRKLIMTEARRAEAEKELRDLDQRIADFRNQKFGQNGELFTKQNELMKPIQDRVFKVIEDIAKEEEYDYVLDKSGQILLMYANKEHDLTQKVLERLKTAATTPTTQQPR